MAGLCLAITTTIGAKSQLKKAMCGHGVRFVNAQRMKEVVLEVLSTILLWLRMQNPIRGDRFAS